MLLIFINVLSLFLSLSLSLSLCGTNWTQYFRFSLLSVKTKSMLICVTSSGTRFGDVLLLWRNFISIWQFVEGLFNIYELSNLLCIGQKFIVVMGQVL